MRRTGLLFTLVVTLAAAGCDPGIYDPGGSKGSGITLSIMSPSAGAMATLGANADLSVDIGFAVSHFTLKPAGMCTSSDGSACGHVHLYVDDMACNNRPAGKTYNNSGAASPIAAKFAWCPTNTGSHKVRLELHDNMHAAVLSGGTPVLQEITFTTSAANANPALSMPWPTNGSTVTMATDANRTVPVYVSASNFIFKPAGMCAGMSNCGHAHLKIDGDACNDTANAKPYNAGNGADGAIPINAKLSLCATPTGSHTITVELHDDMHNSITVSGIPVVTTASVTMQ